SSRARRGTDQRRAQLKLRRLLRRVLDRVPAKRRDSDPACQQAAALATDKRNNITHLIYRNKPYEQHFRDYQFGLATMREHWASGLQDIRKTLAHPQYLAMPRNAAGFITHDVHRDEIEEGMK